MKEGVPIQSSGRISYANPDGSLVIKNAQLADVGNYSCRLFNRNGEDYVHYSLVVLVPPSAPIVRVLSTTLTSIELRWSAETSERSPLQGYMLHYQSDNGQWETKEIDSDYERYRLENLLCGTKYNIFVEAYNKIGLSEPCETIITFTEGMAPTRPPKDRLIDEGIGSITLHLDSWTTNGCPILYFTVEYKIRDTDEWISVEGGAKNTDKKNFLLDELDAETWYNVRMKAYTSAGITEGIYTVGTLTLSGATMNPDVLHSDKGVLFYLDLRIIIPVVVVLIILFLSITTICFVINRKRAEDKRTKGKTPLDVKNAASALGLPSGKEFNMNHAQNSDQLSRRYTSTPTRVALGSQEDLAPYSAYQLPNYHYGELKTFSSGQRKVDGPGNGDLYWQEKKSPASDHSYKDKYKDVNTNLNITPTTNSTTGSITQQSQIPSDSYNTWSSSLKRSQPGLDGRVDPSSEASSKVKAPTTRTGGATEETTFIFPVPPSVNGTAVTIHGTLQGDLYDRLTPSRAGTLQVEKKFPNADESTRLLK
uniref:Fibronectin type-III domain-containing protein n=1 Tax=Strigamia maritima TaxID=126957 RepID=T1JI03_STRMM